jgi:hypothetical protein
VDPGNLAFFAQHLADFVVVVDLYAFMADLVLDDSGFAGVKLIWSAISRIAAD